MRHWSLLDKLAGYMADIMAIMLVSCYLMAMQAKLRRAVSI